MPSVSAIFRFSARVMSTWLLPRIHSAPNGTGFLVLVYKNDPTVCGRGVHAHSGAKERTCVCVCVRVMLVRLIPIQSTKVNSVYKPLRAKRHLSKAACLPASPSLTTSVMFA